MALPEIVGQVGDGVGVGDVQDPALDPAAGAGQVRDLVGRVGDAPLVASGEQDQVVGAQAGGQALDEGAAESLVGARDEGDARNVHDCHGRNPPGVRPTKVTHR